MTGSSFTSCPAACEWPELDLICNGFFSKYFHGSADNGTSPKKDGTPSDEEKRQDAADLSTDDDEKSKQQEEQRDDAANEEVATDTESEPEAMENSNTTLNQEIHPEDVDDTTTTESEGRNEEMNDSAPDESSKVFCEEEEKESSISETIEPSTTDGTIIGKQSKKIITEEPVYEEVRALLFKDLVQTGPTSNSGDSVITAEEQKNQENFSTTGQEETTDSYPKAIDAYFRSIFSQVLAELCVFVCICGGEDIGEASAKLEETTAAAEMAKQEMERIKENELRRLAEEKAQAQREYLEKKAILIQSCRRRMVSRNQYAKTLESISIIQSLARRQSDQNEHKTAKVAATTIQKHGRTFIKRRRFASTISSIVRTQAIARQVAEKGKFQASKNAAITIQSFNRMHRSRCEFVATISSVVLAQACVRRIVAKHIVLRELQKDDAATTIQKKWKSQNISTAKPDGEEESASKEDICSTTSSDTAPSVQHSEVSTDTVMAEVEEGDTSMEDLSIGTTSDSSTTPRTNNDQGASTKNRHNKIKFGGTREKFKNILKKNKGDDHKEKYTSHDDDEVNNIDNVESDTNGETPVVVDDNHKAYYQLLDDGQVQKVDEQLQKVDSNNAHNKE